MAKRKVMILGRKSLSLLLALSMMVSMLQITAFASYPDQVMDGYYQMDADNTIGQSVVPADAHEVHEHGFTLSKTIEQTGLNAFDITLKVVTSQTVTTSDAAIQLVIDNSSSMKDYCAGCGASLSGGYGGGYWPWGPGDNSDSDACDCGAGNRLEAIQEILAGENSFLDSLATSNTGRVLVSVVSFDNGASRVCDWTDIRTEAGLEAVKSAINNLSANVNATNMHAGLLLARNRLGMDAVANAGAKFTILLSDGYANCYGSESDSTVSISLGSSSPGNANPTEDGTDYAAEMAATLSGMSSVYAVGYGTDKDYLVGIIGNEDNVFVGAGKTEISTAFANIAQSATEGMTGAGATVTDPMSDVIILGDVSGAEVNGSTIQWELKPDDAMVEHGDNVTTYTYELTYPIVLDTAKRGFQEDVYYPTNHYTYLSVDVEGEKVEIPFYIPAVCGEVPEESWRVEYYLQDEVGSAEYTMEDYENYGAVDVWTIVSAPEDYDTKYASDNYYFASGLTTMEIVPGGENVMKLYYNIVAAPVTVNHYYNITTIDVDGNETETGYQDVTTHKEDAEVGKAYTAQRECLHGGAEYTFTSADPGETIHISQQNENIINMYYDLLVDLRIPTSAEVKHVYTEYGYALVDGQYELVEKDSVTMTAESAGDLRATALFNVSDAPLIEGYQLNETLGDYADLVLENGTLGFILKVDPEENERTLYFEKIVDNREAVSVIVKHYYTKSVTTVEGGEVVTTVEPNLELGSIESFGAYKGESFEAVENEVYKGDYYESDPGNADKLYVDELTGDMTIELYYTLVEVPEEASIVANHYWITYTEVTVELTEEVTDPETGEVSTVVVGTTTRTDESTALEVLGLVTDGLYEGQSYTEPKRSDLEGYTYNEERSNRTGYAGQAEELNLYYERWADEDVRADADIDVIHNYTTHLTTIVDGEVGVIEVNDGSIEESFPGEDEELRAGDTFVANAYPEYNENTYTQTTPVSDLTKVLQPGTNATIVVDYEREANDLEDTFYNVDYEYRTYTMTVNEGRVAGYWSDPAVETDSIVEPVIPEPEEPGVEGEVVDPAEPEVPGVPGYVGQKVVLEDRCRDGFAPLETNPATTQILAEDGNSWLFVYEQYIPLEKAAVVVNHHYTTNTTTLEGTSSETQTVAGIPYEKYIGESYSADANKQSFELTGLAINGVEAEAVEIVAGVVEGPVRIDFYYLKEVDTRIATAYSIAHEYYLYDYDGSLLGESKPEPIAGSGFVGGMITASPEPNNYTLTDASYSGSGQFEQAGDGYTITLGEENAVVFVYEKTLPRDNLRVTEIHNYYQDEAALQEDAEPRFVYQDTKEVPEDTEYRAELRDETGYVYHSASPESRSIVVEENGVNVIIVNYVRAEASYKVTHIYNKNDAEEGRTSEYFGGFVGDEILADSIAQVPVYNGTSYTYQYNTGDVVLGEESVQEIVFVYNRVVMIPTPNPDPDPTPDPEPPVEPEIPEEPIEIPEEDVPLADLPVEEEIEELPDEEVPLADVPKTGDASLLWMMSTLISAAGLFVLTITGKKREENI